MCPGEGVLRYFHIYVGSVIFLGFKILNLNFLWIFKIMNVLGYGEIVNFNGLGCHHKTGLFFILFYFHFFLGGGGGGASYTL